MYCIYIHTYTHIYKHTYIVLMQMCHYRPVGIKRGIKSLKPFFLPLIFRVEFWECIFYKKNKIKLVLYIQMMVQYISNEHYKSSRCFSCVQGNHKIQYLLLSMETLNQSDKWGIKLSFMREHSLPQKEANIES